MRRGRHSEDPALAESSAIALKVSLVLLGCGIAWVLATDLLVYEFVSNKVVLARLEADKGWLFVALAVAILYVTMRRTVRKLARSNATLQAVVTSMSDGLFLIDRRGAITYANPAAARILGTEPSDLLGLDGPAFARRFNVALPNGRLIEPTRYVSQRALKGETPPPYKAVLHPPGKPDVFVIVTGAPVRPVPEGPPALALSVMHDVTAIEHVETMRDAFVSSAAHMLKTPVAVIDAQVALLANKQTPSLEASTAAIRRQCARIARIVDNLLVLARIRSETLRLQPEAIDLANIVNEVAREMRTATADHRLSLNLQTRPMVFADRARLMLVIRNLIDLAYRRSLPRTTVALALEQDDSTGRVSVTYQSTTPIEVPTGSDVEAGFGGLGLERYVTEELVGAANGAMGADIPAANMRRDWIDIPVMEEHARA